jgi:hypothetical protein
MPADMIDAPSAAVCEEGSTIAIDIPIKMVELSFSEIAGQLLTSSLTAPNKGGATAPPFPYA